MADLNNSDLDEAFRDITVAEELLDRMQEMSCESETAYVIQMACARALIGLELNKLNERLESWDDGDKQCPGMRITNYPEGGWD